MARSDELGRLNTEVLVPIEEFIQRDPYVRNGLIASWQIRRWITVVGDTAQSPINPKVLP